MIRVEGLTKKYGSKIVLNDLTFNIKKGEIIGLIGPNGAGKTTLISILTGLINQSSGDVFIEGKSVKDKSIKNKIGVMLQDNIKLSRIKVKEIIELYRTYYEDCISVEEVLDIANLKDYSNSYISKLSGGQLRRLSFGLCMTSDPDLIFLDEPTVGMDTSSREKFWRKIQEIKEKGKTIILTSHYLNEMEKVASKIMVLKDGKIIKHGDMKTILDDLVKTRVEFECNDFKNIEHIKCVDKVDINNNHIVLYTSNSDETIRSLVDKKVLFESLEIKKGNLDDVFKEIVEGV